MRAAVARKKVRRFFSNAQAPIDAGLWPLRSDPTADRWTGAARRRRSNISSSTPRRDLLAYAQPRRVRRFRNVAFILYDLALGRRYALHRDSGVSVPGLSPLGALCAHRLAYRDPRRSEGQARGCGDYQMTAAVWVRGFLTHEYGVEPEDIVWVTGKPIRSIKPPVGVRMESIPADTTLEAMLELGEIDVLVSVMIPSGFGKTVRRLFRDARKVEVEYYSKTRIFPIMPTVERATSPSRRCTTPMR